jgi:hypothetical protein
MTFIKYPVTVGSKWTWRGQADAPNLKGMPSTAKIQVAAREKVTTPAGTFNAYRIETVLIIVAGPNRAEVPNTYWLAPGVGLVQNQATAPSQTGPPTSIVAKLAKYVIK